MITIGYVRERLAELREPRLRHKAGSATAAKGGAKGLRSRKAAKRGGGKRVATGRPSAGLSLKAARKTSATKAASKTTRQAASTNPAATATKKAAAAKKSTRKTGKNDVAARRAAKRPIPQPDNASTTIRQVSGALPAKKRSAKATKKGVPTENQIRLAVASTRKYSSLENALRALDSNAMMVPILRGRDGRYWIPATNKQAGRLIRARQATALPNNTLFGRK